MIVQGSQIAYSPVARAQTGEPSTAEKMIGAGLEPKLRQQLLRDLGKLPPAALSKLHEAGWSIQLVDYKPNSNGTKDGGQCRTGEKIVELDRQAYQNDKDGKILLHELAHALDFKGCEAPGLMRKLLGVGGKAIMGTDKNAAFAGIYQKFQAQHTISLAQNALKIRQESDPTATQVAFSTAFQGGMQAALMEGKLIVLADSKQAANQSQSKGIETAVGEVPAKLEINGVEVKNSRHEKNAVTVVDQHEAARLSISWTQADSYVAASSLPSELFAEGVAAYLGSPDSRQALLQQSPEVHAFVEQSMNEYLIAGPGQAACRT